MMMNKSKIIIIEGNPLVSQIKYWHKLGLVATYFSKSKKYQGKISHTSKILPHEVDAVVFIKNYKSGFYLRDIVRYSCTPDMLPLFLGSTDSPDKLGLAARGKIFWVRKSVLELRLQSFYRMVESNQERGSHIVDLSDPYSPDELEALLKYIEAFDCDTLTLNEATCLLAAAKRLGDEKIMANAEARVIDRTIEQYKDFCRALHQSNFKALAQYLKEGIEVDVNLKEVWGRFKIFSYHPCINETAPLIFAIKKGDIPLVNFLLDHGADIEKLSTFGETPLMVAIGCHPINFEMTQLLLKRGANPNAKNGYAMEIIFRTMREHSMESQKPIAQQVVRILLCNGFFRKAEAIKNALPKGTKEVFEQIYSAECKQLT